MATQKDVLDDIALTLLGLNALLKTAIDKENNIQQTHLSTVIKTLGEAYSTINSTPAP